MRVRIATLIVCAAALFFAAGTTHAQVPATAAPDVNRALRKEIIVAASQADVWQAWTTRDGVRSFFAPDANVSLAIGGDYEIYFMPTAPLGSRGADGNKVLAFTAPRILAFSWNAPPTLPNVRKVHTRVIIELEPLGPRQTRVRLTHDSFGWGEEWDKTLAYFDKAWDYVLGNLKKRFDEGPIDWSKRM